MNLISPFLFPSAATCDTWPGSEDGIGILGADIVEYVHMCINKDGKRDLE